MPGRSWLTGTNPSPLPRLSGFGFMSIVPNVDLYTFLVVARMARGDLGLAVLGKEIIVGLGHPKRTRFLGWPLQDPTADRAAVQSKQFMVSGIVIF